MPGHRRTRRRILQSGGVVAAFGLAGCNALSGDSGGGDDEADDEADDEEADDGDSENQTDPSSEQPGDGGTDMTGAVTEGDLTYGDTHEGEITEDSDTGPDGDLGEPLTFTGSAGDRVTIRMTSEELDTYLLLEGPGGDVLAENDDGASGYNSQMQYTLEQNGEYTIWATTYNGGETGPFTLTLDQVTLLEDVGSVEYGQAVRGEITEDTGTDPDGDLAQPVTFQGSEGDTAVITVQSDPLDPYVTLVGPSGDVVGRDDDGAGGYNSRLETTLGESGEYTIWVSTYSGRGTGPFTLTLRRRS